MKQLRMPLMVLAAVALLSSSLLLTGVTAQNQSSALERGFRTGYSDGYTSGFGDISSNAPRNYQNKTEYQKADRNFNEAWGTLEDYRDGYQQGFEAGYSAGFERQIFNSSIPPGLTRRGAAEAQTTTADAGNTAPVDDAVNNSANTSAPAIVQPVNIRRDQMILVELDSNLSTEATQAGDRFEARIIDPRNLEGAIVEGRVVRIRRAGKLKGSAEMQLSFETIRTRDNRTAQFTAQVVEVVNTNQRDDEASSVDSEGGIKGKDSTKDDVAKVGASTGIGAIIGAIAGGGRGAAIGAAIGGSVGTAGVLGTRGKELRLSKGQQLRIRAATDTNID